MRKASVRRNRRPEKIQYEFEYEGEGDHNTCWLLASRSAFPSWLLMDPGTKISLFKVVDQGVGKLLLDGVL